MEMMRADDPFFQKFGQSYVSVAYPGVVKGWHLHQRMVLNYAVPHGSIKMVLYDDRDGSRTKGEVQEIFLGEQNHVLVQVPARVWNGFSGVSRPGENVIRLGVDTISSPDGRSTRAHSPTNCA